MGLPVEFAINTKRGVLHSSTLFQDSFNLALFSGEVKTCSITLVADAPSLGFGRLAVQSSAGIALTIGLIDGTKANILTSTLMTNDVGNIFTGDLLLNVAAITGIIEFPYQAYFEANISTAGNPLKIQVPVTIQKGALAIGLAPTVAPDVAIGVNEARASFVLNRGSKQFIMTDQTDGSEHLISIQGGQLTVSPVT